MRVWLCWLLLCHAVWAWDFRGHRVVVGIAWDYLGPVTRAWVEEGLTYHPDSRARDRDGAAVWPDLLGEERPQSMPWHYINLPLGPGPEPADHDQVVWALDHWLQVARMAGEPALRAEALAFLLHFVGDIHQPLHASNYYGPAYPEGDRGGGSVALSHPTYRNLHQLWDMAGYPPDTSATEIQAEALRTSVGNLGSIQDFSIWARESNQLARQAYPGDQPPTEITPEYQDICRRICTRRLHLAGFRLAYLLQRLGPEADYAQ